MKGFRLNIQKMIAVTAMALAIPLSVQADSPDEGRKTPHAEMRHHHKHGGMAMLKKLDLSETQQAKIDQILKQQAGSRESILKEKHSNRDELTSLAEQDSFDTAKAERLIAQQQDKDRAAKLEKLRTQHEIYKILTPAQREKAKAMRTEWKEKMKSRYKNKNENSSKAL